MFPDIAYRWVAALTLVSDDDHQSLVTTEPTVRTVAIPNPVCRYPVSAPPLLGSCRDELTPPHPVAEYNAELITLGKIILARNIATDDATPTKDRHDRMVIPAGVAHQRHLPRMGRKRKWFFNSLRKHVAVRNKECTLNGVAILTLAVK
jgi:hypothetical protein